MKRSVNISVLSGLALLVIISLSACAQQDAGELPREFLSASCTKAPAIDGANTAGEWDEARKYEFLMPMGSASSVASTAKVVLYLMNSASDLYIGMQVEDDSAQASLEPVDLDLFAIGFCKGASLEAGDDRRFVAQGLYGDKYFVSAGQDADDTQKDGEGTMVWGKGAWFMETRIPLASGDTQDLQARPGETLKWNLVFGDNFKENLTGTAVGGLFSGDMDNAISWGYLKLAGDVTEAVAPSAPEWLEALFPWTGEPDEFAHRLQRLEAKPLAVNGEQGGEVTCKFIYPEIDGTITEGLIKFFLPPQASEPGVKVPLLHYAGYETDAGGVMPFLELGCAVSTVHANGWNPLSRGPNFEWAMMHAERRLPFVDDGRVFVRGGSAGGYMTLMVASETFPLLGASPDVPPTNWAYNAAFIGKNKAIAGTLKPGTDQPQLPVTFIVSQITDQAEARFGSDWEAPAYFNLSPVRVIEGITAPVLGIWSSADMLVPIQQVSPDYVQPYVKADFPEGFKMGMEELLARPEERLSLFDVVPASNRRVFVIPAPEGAGKLQPDGSVVDGTHKPIEIPFCETVQWSIVIVDEGAPEPHIGHFKYALGPDVMPFIKWILRTPVQPGQLTSAKLELLMRRFQGLQQYQFNVETPEGEPYQARMLDFEQAERFDVVRSLLTFAQDDACATRLAQLYAGLPSERRALGPRLGDFSADSVREALRKWETILQ